MTLPFTTGDYVGIKDSPFFTHWTQRGRVAELLAIPGEPVRVNVRLEGKLAILPVDPALLIPAAADATQDWMAQAFPTNNDPPGPPMYFASFQDLLVFAWQFSDQKLDETLHVRTPDTAQLDEKAQLERAGAVVA